MSKAGALHGITVIDLSRLLPGPYCSMVLADHGARVIAIEDKRFLADDLFFNLINRNKEHMALNLKTDEGKEIFFRLVKSADVVMEGFRPGVVDRLGVGYQEVRDINPGIIYCSITGYGQDGPFRDRVGHDANYLSYAGVLDLIGESGHPPSIPGVPIADIAGGGMNAAIGILLALFAREKTGKGQYIDISMTDGMAGFLPTSLFFQQRTGQEPRRADELLSHRYACYNTYETADGRYLSIGAVENRFWAQLCDLLDVPEYALLQYDDSRRKEIIAAMRTTFKQKTLDEWDAVLADHDICWGRVQSLSEVMADPLFRQREMVVDVKGKDGSMSKTLGVPVKLSETPGSVRTPPVDFGESTTAILEEFGYTQEEIKTLAEKKVL
ncbi:MAG: CoA transferase [Deltaproteobacteria bacterium]|nr:CoA transferase [Candidatus Anaeroferrophillus wilburensis]MBN2889818.1 CoA transferase [Deltaproteobacteria bacterium]